MAYDDYMGYRKERDPWRLEDAENDTRRYPTAEQTIWDPPAEETTIADEPAKTSSVWGSYKPQGLDQGKIDSGHDSPKYQIGKVLSNFDPRMGVTGEVLAALNQLGIGTFTGQDDKLYVGGNVDPRFGNVLSSDINIGFKTGNGQWGSWGSPVGAGAEAPPAAAPVYTPPSLSYAPSMGGGANASVGTGSGTSTSTSTSTTGLSEEDKARKAELMALLQQRMNQGLDVNPNDPIIKNQVDHFGAKQEGTRRRYMTEAAERLSAQGLGSSGRLNNEQRFADEQSALSQGQFQAELIGRELIARRQEIQHAIDTMGSLLTEGERQSLQMELATMDNALRRYGIDTQNSQYFAGLGQADRQFAAELAQRDRLAAMDDAFRNAQLGQADSQFRDRLGFDVSDRQTYWDALRRGYLG